MRNTTRRRLREIVRDLDRNAPDGLPNGLYLIGTQRGAKSYAYVDLRDSLAVCLAKLDRVVL